MHTKQELIEKLTGIQSSRLSYYSELTLAMAEMQKKNKQLEILNQLTKIHLNNSWQDTSKYIASRLYKVFQFDSFVLSLVDSSITSFLCSVKINAWHCEQIEFHLQSEEELTEFLHKKLALSRPGLHATSVCLTNQMKKVFGFLTFLHDQTVHYTTEESIFFQGVANYVGVVLENILLFQDVSKKVSLEAQLIHSAKLAAIGEMAAGVAHELNSPLTAILGNVQLLMRQMKSGQAHQMLHDIFQCGLRSKKIIQNLLTFSRQDEYHYETINLNDSVRDTLSLINYQLQVSGITVDVQLHELLPYIQGSPHQIEQVLINLLLNARDATQDVNMAHIQIETGLMQRENADYVFVSILDNGIGIKEKNIPQIFNPFFTTKEKMKGTGLGLSVSLGIAQSHGGKLLVESKEDQFCKFTFLIPARDDGGEMHG